MRYLNSKRGLGPFCCLVEWLAVVEEAGCAGVVFDAEFAFESATAQAVGGGDSVLQGEESRLDETVFAVEKEFAGIAVEFVFIIGEPVVFV